MPRSTPLKPRHWRTSTAVGWVGRLQLPIRDPRFWVIQMLVLGIDTTHLLLEREPLLLAESQFYLLSVSILLAPVVYAGMSFGVRGALPTTIWALVLSAPEIYGHSASGSWSSSPSCS
jgi:hypothetical protein